MPRKGAHTELDETLFRGRAVSGEERPKRVLYERVYEVHTMMAREVDTLACPTAKAAGNEAARRLTLGALGVQIYRNDRPVDDAR